MYNMALMKFWKFLPSPSVCLREEQNYKLFCLINNLFSVYKYDLIIIESWIIYTQTKQKFSFFSQSPG